MPLPLAQASNSILLLVDIQPSFLAAIHESDRVLARARFIASIAKLLEIPVLATEQYPTRMGGTESSLCGLMSQPAMPKMEFSCCGADGISSHLSNSGRKQVVLVGIETHICVNQTAHDLLEMGLHVFICADATSSRTKDRYETGLARMSQAGAVVAHTESVVYEWLKTAENPSFREALKLVKEASW